MTSTRRFFLLSTAAVVLSFTGCNALLNTAIKAGMAKLMFACVPEGVEIDTPDGRVAIESIRAGDSVIGYDGGPVQVMQVHAYSEDPVPVRFYRVSFVGGATVNVCDMHRIGGQRARDLRAGISVGGEVVKSIEIYGGVERSYDLLTEDDGYRIDGIPVNSMILEMAAAAAKR
ncbi:MAG: hypothetical protein ACR2RV_01090 [Verrucomicrobiales bacterium]